MTQTTSDLGSELEELKQLWFDQAQEDSLKILTMVAAYEEAPAEHPQFPQELYRVFHDLQGQSGLFNYALLATLGSRLCGYWRKVQGQIGAEQLPVVRAHIVALRFVLERRLEGNGGPAGQAILAKLEALTQG